MVGPTSAVAEAPIAAGADPSAGLRDALRSRIQKGDLALPMLPQVANQVIAASSDPSTDAGKLSVLIHRDPSLAGQVLKIANSPAYQPRMPIVSLQQAVARLGLSVLTEIALAASLQSGVFKVPGFEKELSQLWRLSLAAGAWAKEVARSRRFSVESAFLGGLLHAVGKPVVLQAAVDEQRKTGRPSLDVLRAALPGLLTDLHVEAGMLLGKRWELPGAVAACLAHYRAPEHAGAFVNDAATAALADLLAVRMVSPTEVDNATLREHPAFTALNFYQDEIDALLAKAPLVERVVESLSV